MIGVAASHLSVEAYNIMQSKITISYDTMFWPLASWARYLAFADILRERYEDSLQLPDEEEVLTEDALPALNPVQHSQRSYRLQKDAAFAYYHSSLLPVIEGWNELRLADDRIHALLQHEDGFYTAMRRHRNAIFHYQKEFFGTKQSELYESGDKVVFWVIFAS
jgi:hypothetical protein